VKSEKDVVAVALAAVSTLFFAFLAMPDRLLDLVIYIASVAICAAIPLIFNALFADALQHTDKDRGSG
jgi:hypothetical protein